MPTVGWSIGLGLGQSRARAAPWSRTKCSVYSCMALGLSASAVEVQEHDASDAHFSFSAIVEEQHVKPPPASEGQRR